MKRGVIAGFLIASATAFAQPKQPPKPDTDPWAGRTDLLTPPSIAPSTQVDIGAVERYTLPNGLLVIVVPRRSIPAVDVTLAIRAGESSDPIDRSGLAQFTASMLRKGTLARTSDQIAEAIDFVGGELAASTDDDGSIVGCKARAKDLTLCLDLVADLAQRPTFLEAEMGEIRDQLNASVEGAKDSPQALAAQHASNLYFGDGDTRGRPMSKRSLAAIDRAAIVEFHKTWYSPSNAVMAISGDVDPKALKNALKKWFGRWKKQAVPARPARTLPPLPESGKLAVRIVDKPDATQSTMVVVGPGIAHHAPDYFAVKLMNFTLGAGGFSSRLMKVVRSEGGKSYGARSSFEVGRQPGPFVATTFTRNAETMSTVQLVLGEIARMRKTGPTPEELQAAKGNLIGGYGLTLETGGDVARALLTSELDLLDAQFVVQYPARLAAVTVEDTAKAAAAHLQPAALVIVGKAQDVLPQLSKSSIDSDGKIDVVPYTVPVSAAERRAAADEKKTAGAMTPAEAEAGKKLLADALTAKGGAAQLAKVTDLAMSGKGTMTVQGQTLPIAIEEFLLPGKAARQDVTVGPGKVVQVFASGKAFMKQGERIMDLPPQASTSMQKGLWRDPNFILLHASAPDAKVRALPLVQEGAATFDAVVVIAPDGEPTTLHLDPKTHHIIRMLYKDDGKDVRDELGDYRPESGIAFPRKFTHLGDGQKIDVTYETIAVNKGLPPETFKR